MKTVVVVRHGDALVSIAVIFSHNDYLFKQPFGSHVACFCCLPIKGATDRRTAVFCSAIQAQWPKRLPGCHQKPTRGVAVAAHPPVRTSTASRSELDLTHERLSGKDASLNGYSWPCSRKKGGLLCKWAKSCFTSLRRSDSEVGTEP